MQYSIVPSSDRQTLSVVGKEVLLSHKQCRDSVPVSSRVDRDTGGRSWARSAVDWFASNERQSPLALPPFATFVPSRSPTSNTKTAVASMHRPAATAPGALGPYLPVTTSCKCTHYHTVNFQSQANVPIIILNFKQIWRFSTG